MTDPKAAALREALVHGEELADASEPDAAVDVLAEALRAALAYIARLEREQGEVVGTLTVDDEGDVEVDMHKPEYWDFTSRNAGFPECYRGVAYKIVTIPEQSDGD